jgi:uncharacterized DUF497 family protein
MKRKSLSNQRKHGVSFQLASKVFMGPLFVSLKERIETGEQRWQTIGEIDGYLLLVVAHTVIIKTEFEQEVEVIRVISARSATRKEKRLYEEENG